jgi:hypothetical protein
MEGMSPADPVATRPRDLLAVDLTEYLEGDTFAEANAVLVSQLKYSSRGPNKAWTASELCKRRAGSKNSVISRLAETFEVHRQNEERAEVLKKLSLRLVSNRPPHPDLIALLTRIRVELNARPGRVRTATLRSRLGSRQQADLDRLYCASRLTSTGFTDFLRILDLTDLSAGMIDSQEDQIVRTLGSHMIGTVEDARNRLYRLFKDQTLPSAAGSRVGIRGEDLLVRLGVNRHADMFPAPPSFRDPDEAIPMPAVDELADSIRSGSARILLHGNAGVGKTTVLGLLATTLGPKSIVIRYDCFGGDLYLTPTEARHQVPIAIQQLANELWVTAGTPFLLDRGEPFAMWRHLQNALECAGSVASATGGHVVIAIDAADNSVIAGQVRGDDTFVPDLWKLAVPSGVHIVVSCRTARIELVAPPDGVPQVQIVGFDKAGSATHLRTRFPQATDEECGRFHERSAGIPRSQFYVLDPERSGAPETLDDVLNEAARTPDNIFDDLVQTALHSVSGKDAGYRHLADLVCLSRAVTVDQFAAATDLSEQGAQRFCDALAPGVIVADEAILFRDEDFEAHLRQLIDDDARLRAHNRIGDHTLSIRGRDEYAATVCAEHLYQASRSDDLIDLALNDGDADVIDDPVSRVQVRRRRLQLALRICEDPERRVDAVKLLILSAEVAASNNAVIAVVRKRPDLAARHADGRSIAAIYDHDDSEPWRGPRHLRVAGLLARSGDLEGAWEQLQMASAWLSVRRELEEHESWNWRIEPDELAAGLVALRACKGTDAAIRYLSGWRPMSFRLDTSHALVEALILHGDPDVLTDVGDAEIPPWLRASLFERAIHAGANVPADELRSLAAAVLARPPSKARRAQLWALSFAELLAAATRDRALVSDWLTVFHPVAPRHAPSSHEGLGDWAPVVRHRCMSSTTAGEGIEPASFIPASWQDEDGLERREKSRRAGQREALSEALSAELPLYMLRARALLGAATFPDLEQQLDAAVGLAVGRRHREHLLAWPGRRLDAAIDTLLWSGGDTTRVGELLEQVVTRTEESTQQAAHIRGPPPVAEAPWDPRRLHSLELRMEHDEEWAAAQAAEVPGRAA